jgi:N-acetylmuramoyl-L-alanine amidase
MSPDLHPPPRPTSRAARAALGVCLAAAVLAPLAEALPARQARVERASSSRPDRTLYRQAQRVEATLRATPKRQARRSEWEAAVLGYRRVVARYPQSPYCDNALLAVGDLYRDMARRFKSARHRDDAVDAYRSLVAEYPSSSLGEKALYAVIEIEIERGDRKRLADAAKAYLAAFPDASRAATVKALVRKSAPERAASLPTAPPPGLAQVFNLRFWSGASSTRVVIDVERRVPIRFDRIADPERLWIDLQGTRLHPNLKDRAFPVGDGLLEQVRIAQNQDAVVRVVLDFKEVDAHNVFYLQDPTRLVIDVQGSPAPRVAAAEREPASPSPAASMASPSPSPPLRVAAERAPSPLPPSPSPSPAAPAAGGEPTAPEALPTRRVATAAPRPDATPAPSVRRATPVEIDMPPPRRAEAPRPVATPTPAPPSGARREETRTAEARPPEAPAPPQPNRSGSISLARQLGLGARRIVVDAGHGGHDPGTIGRGGLQEKDLVLDVALRLAEMLRRELGAEVILTRSTDVFIPLEERTAIANSKGADLFLSIHANSSRNAGARGIETYFLNFAKNPHAEAVAARENAISAATLKDLQGLVKAIALNSKIDESRDFAASIQEAMVGGLRPKYGRDVVDRGVHTAPFYVLIGANMPSILAEIAFVSHPEDERRLKRSEHRDEIARSLFEGVRGYLEALNRTQLRQLTRGGGRPTVGSRGARR